MNETDAPPKLFLTPRECADLAGVSIGLITKGCRNGSIKAVKMGSVWRINKAAFLSSMGLDEGGEG